jgi:hypothetical protein
LDIWEKRKASGEASKESRPLTFLNFGKDTLKLKCREVVSGLEFEMKIIEAKEQDQVIIYFGSLSPIVQSKGLDFKRAHNKMATSQLFFDYLTRLVKGEICGLFLNGKENASLSVQLAS